MSIVYIIIVIVVVKLLQYVVKKYNLAWLKKTQNSHW